MVKENIFTTIDKGLRYLDKKKKMAKICPFCGAYEFNIDYLIWDWLYHPTRAYDLTNDDKIFLHNEIIKKYKLPDKFGGFSIHHISYVMDIIMYCCRECHKKIHYSDNEPWSKYKPIDKKNDPKLWEKACSLR